MALISETGINGKLKQASRHAKILERINNGEELTIASLSTEWDVSTKTLQRDFDTIIQLGHPVQRSENGKSFIKSQNNSLDDNASMIVEMLNSMAKDIGGEFYNKTHKLLNRLENYIATPYYTHIDIEDISGKFDFIKELEYSIKNRLFIELAYSRINKNESLKFSNIIPLRILTFNGFWYLLAEHKGKIKKFYVKEIKKINVLDDHFKLDSSIHEKIENSLNVWFNPGKEPYEVRLYLEKNIVPYFQRKPVHKNQKLYLQPDKSAELTIKITHENEILPLVRNWLPHIRIIEPESLQEKLNSELIAYLGGIGKI